MYFLKGYEILRAKVALLRVMCFTLIKTNVWQLGYWAN